MEPRRSDSNDKPQQSNYAELDTSRIRILVVDDEPEVLRLVGSVLRGMGINDVKQAADGEEALSIVLAQSRRIDLIICDWSMPKLSGLDLLQEIRGNNLTIPFLMITGNADEEAVRSAKGYGVSAYIAKPFSIGDLERKVLRLLKREKVQKSDEGI
ncbi:MAG: response regulator [Rhodospirillales bacterium]|nr:response regulator [Rhodospirillales bacterium]